MLIYQATVTAILVLLLLNTLNNLRLLRRLLDQLTSTCSLTVSLTSQQPAFSAAFQFRPSLCGSACHPR